MSKQIVSTNAAPAAIGPYSQAVRAGDTVYLSGQIALDPDSGVLIDGGFEAQVVRALENLKAVAEAAGGSLSDCVKLTLYLTDLDRFPVANELMQRYFAQPYPARATIGVSSLPRGAEFEVEAVMVLS
ncbi:MAG: RidA family protein [Burkholderiaceae bacterium]